MKFFTRKKKIYKEAIIIAIIALLALPDQQMLLKYFAKRATIEELSPRALKENWSECALSGNGEAVIKMARVNFLEKNFKAAEAWMKFGVYQLENPAVILFYGDYLNMQGNKVKAQYLYRFAKKRAISMKEPKQFIDEVNKRLKK